MKHKFLLLMIVALMIGSTGCAKTEDDSLFQMGDTNTIEFVEIIDQKPTANEDFTPNNEIMVSHALPDESIVFTSEVAVVPYTILTSYNSSTHTATLRPGYTIGDCTYAYVNYSPSGKYVFQRISKVTADDSGSKIITLSGTEVQLELSEEEFMSLITHIDLVGEEGDYNSSDNTGTLEDMIPEEETERVVDENADGMEQPAEENPDEREYTLP